MSQIDEMCFFSFLNEKNAHSNVWKWWEMDGICKENVSIIFWNEDPHDLPTCVSCSTKQHI